ncbi:hypothetical protein JOC78_002868 [Bacillus ectoiniformans]|uniref:DUF4003 family protein n=1 Tax=Bacillus ectoiniformans TaxID=1494429 RepID=UPI00195CBE8E|nr:DUF4003 family protein [Bacillus ectoiniformans]MBM7649884.1 hypothetical protein [Bacillus ectoiniformans]
MEEMIDKVEKYKEIYTQLKKKLRWKVSDSRTLMMVASLYVTTNREFHMDQFEELSDYIKDEVGVFSTLKSQGRFTFAALLDTRFDSPKERVADFLAMYDTLVKTGFSRSIFTYIAAITLLEEENGQETAASANELYKKMKSEHLFLTGQSDYPLAALLAQRKQPADQLIGLIEEYYSKLNHAGFKKGNDLQSMSHILSLKDSVNPEEMVSRCTHIFDQMKLAGMKPKAMFYPQIALLSFLEDDTEQLAIVKNIQERLNAEKLFKWHKDLNFMMAVHFLISSRIEHSSLLQTSLSTTIEVLIQAQQAASMAAIAGASAASASGGDGG